jgi:hypothetical protein
MSRYEIYRLLNVEPRGILLSQVTIVAWGQQVHLECLYDPDRNLRFRVIFRNCTKVSWQIVETDQDLSREVQADVIAFEVGVPNHEEASLILTDLFHLTIVYGEMKVEKIGNWEQAMKEQLRELIKKYEGRIRDLGGEMGTSTQYALEVVDELEKMGVIIEGIAGWYEAGPRHPPGRAVEDLGVQFSVGDEVMRSPDAVHQAAAFVRHYIQHKLKPKTAYISFTLHSATRLGLFDD